MVEKASFVNTCSSTTNTKTGMFQVTQQNGIIHIATCKQRNNHGANDSVLIGCFITGSFILTFTSAQSKLRVNYCADSGSVTWN